MRLVTYFERTVDFERDLTPTFSVSYGHLPTCALVQGIRHITINMTWIDALTDASRQWIYGRSLDELRNQRSLVWTPTKGRFHHPDDSQYSLTS
jgi:hypothetical protein